MERYDSRIAKMLHLSTSLAAFRHRALLIAESIMLVEDPAKRKQARLDHLHSTIEGLETALEMERRLEQAPLAPPVLWA